MKHLIRVFCIAMALSGCAKTTYGPYPETWPALSGLGPDCRGIVGTYDETGVSIAGVGDAAGETRRTASLSRHVYAAGRGAKSKQDFPRDTVAIRFSIPAEGKVLVEAIDKWGWVLDLAEWDRGSQQYDCDEHGLTVKQDRPMMVLGYNSDYAVITKAMDGPLILRQTSRAIGMTPTPIIVPVPASHDFTNWTRFQTTVAPSR